MPCVTYGDTYGNYENQKRGEKNKLSWHGAVLCGIFTALEQEDKSFFQTLIDSIDWERTGVPKEIVTSWWDQHKLEDAEREKNIKENALAKLTDEEKRILKLL